ncbi:MAG: methyltransferase domain-containing protein [Fibrobacterota bacterium]|nr:methyltransferase domain-containing protein [Fibrobacterota bacterium]QQS07071.1 MAG: methyltransferase domain-containing protein [Fibrobacterota bacterium]
MKNNAGCCPLCGKDSKPLFTLRNSPRLQNVLFDSEGQAKAVAHGDYDFRLCPTCVHGFNPGFQSEDIEYDTDYDNDQSASPRYRAHVEWVVDHLTDACDLTARSRVLEIGCGNGYLLSRIAEKTGSVIDGFDPAYNGRYGDPSRFSREYFQPTADRSWDLVILRHCLDSFTDPGPIVEAAAKALGTSGRLYVESADLDYILREGDFSLFYHECARYFSKTSLAIYLAQQGLVAESSNSSFGGQYFSCVFRPIPDPSLVASSPERILRNLTGFRKILIWGISGRAITILSHLALGKEVVAFGVDIAQAKHGRHIPVTGQKILSPQEASEFQPDLVLIPNRNYEDEIRPFFPSTTRFLTLQDALS